MKKVNNYGKKWHFAISWKIGINFFALIFSALFRHFLDKLLSAAFRLFYDPLRSKVHAVLFRWITMIFSNTFSMTLSGTLLACGEIKFSILRCWEWMLDINVGEQNTCVKLLVHEALCKKLAELTVILGLCPLWFNNPFSMTGRKFRESINAAPPGLRQSYNPWKNDFNSSSWLYTTEKNHSRVHAPKEFDAPSLHTLHFIVHKTCSRKRWHAHSCYFFSVFCIQSWSH